MLIGGDDTLFMQLIEIFENKEQRTPTKRLIFALSAFQTF